MGIAVFNNKELIRWQMKLFTGSWSSGKLKRILSVIERILDEQAITCIALKQHDKSRTSDGIELLEEAIIKLAISKRIEFYEYSIDELKKGCGKEEVANKKSLMSLISDKHPCLAYEYERQAKIHNPYYVKLFEAVACGMCANTEI